MKACFQALHNYLPYTIWPILWHGMAAHVVATRFVGLSFRAKIFSLRSFQLIFAFGRLADVAVVFVVAHHAMLAMSLSMSFVVVVRTAFICVTTGDFSMATETATATITNTHLPGFSSVSVAVATRLPLTAGGVDTIRQVLAMHNCNYMCTHQQWNVV